MAFICPDCDQKSLEIIHSLELGSDGVNDEHTLQSVLCSHCGLTCVAEYCESRRGVRDRWSHLAYRLSREDFRNLNAKLNSCSTPRNPKCGCATHQYFRVMERSQLRPLSKLVHGDSFFLLTERT